MFETMNIRGTTKVKDKRFAIGRELYALHQAVHHGNGKFLAILADLGISISKAERLMKRYRVQARNKL